MTVLLLRLVGEHVLLVGGAGEDAAERVVVLGKDWIVLVVVTAGAGDGKAEHAAGHGIDALIAFGGAPRGCRNYEGVP